ncbi:MAG: hypothetical protein AB7P07_12955 [Hyphomonadaceae bacterium]
MARSVLNSFVSGTRQMLAVQLFASVGAVALAGYTVGVTNNLIRERDRLTERVIQLEEALAREGVVPPPSARPIREADAAAPVYPGAPAEEVVVVEEPSLEGGEEAPAPSTVEPGTPPANPAAPSAPETRDDPTTTTPPSGSQGADATQQPQAPSATQTPGIDLATQVLRDLLTPAPPLRTLVLHVRSRADYDEAQAIAGRLGQSGLRISIAIREPNDQTATGYAYYHGRQGRAAADLAQSVQEAARTAGIAAWAVQLRGAGLPAQGDYTADRVDVVLPALPSEPAPGTRVNPDLRNQTLRTQPSVVQQPQQEQPILRRRVTTQPDVAQEQDEFRQPN